MATVTNRATARVRAPHWPARSTTLPALTARIPAARAYNAIGTPITPADLPAHAGNTTGPLVRVALSRPGPTTREPAVELPVPYPGEEGRPLGLREGED